MSTSAQLFAQVEFEYMYNRNAYLYKKKKNPLGFITIRIDTPFTQKKARRNSPSTNYNDNNRRALINHTAIGAYLTLLLQGVHAYPSSVGGMVFSSRITQLMVCSCKSRQQTASILSPRYFHRVIELICCSSSSPQTSQVQLPCKSKKNTKTIKQKSWVVHKVHQVHHDFRKISKIVSTKVQYPRVSRMFGSINLPKTNTHHSFLPPSL